MGPLLVTALRPPQFVTDVMKPLKIEDIIDQEVPNLSGGELQRVAIALCLGKPADVYLIDEPSAYLDSEQRLVAAKVIKRSVQGTEVKSRSSRSHLTRGGGQFTEGRGK